MSPLHELRIEVCHILFNRRVEYFLDQGFVLPSRQSWSNTMLFHCLELLIHIAFCSLEKPLVLPAILIPLHHAPFSNKVWSIMYSANQVTYRSALALFSSWCFLSSSFISS